MKEADWEEPSIHGKHKNTGSFLEAEKNTTLKRGDRFIETEGKLCE